MDRTERFYKMRQLLDQKGLVRRENFLEHLGVSLATFKRDLEYLRDRMNHPILWDPIRQGYCLEKKDGRVELPGLWLSSREAAALLTMKHLMEELDSGYLKNKLAPLQEKIFQSLGEDHQSLPEVLKRIRVFRARGRVNQPEFFQEVSKALFSRQRLWVAYHSRYSNEEKEREISPQRLVYYRDNWYLDGWCHLRKALRSFSLDAVRKARVLDKPAKDVNEETLDCEFASGYGIFSGSRVKWATLKFSPKQARWISSEVWHPNQKSHFEGEDYFLEVPYSDDREILQDILRYGADVEVMNPPELRQKVGKALKEAVKNYEK